MDKTKREALWFYLKLLQEMFASVCTMKHHSIVTIS